ncbi:MAG: hypothetical protein LBG99_02465 [Propionibacteriaceae bacterium]|jgi:hypothetical protein|nr:hypothetical protein [Propionibacteriaceae bacterium]
MSKIKKSINVVGGDPIDLAVKTSWISDSVVHHFVKKSTRRSSRLGLVLVVGLSVMVLAACSTIDKTATPQFTGPWGDIYAYYYETSESELGREILSDGVITDMEFQEAMLEIEQCYLNDGFRVTYDPYGFETVESIGGTQDPLEEMGKCAFADGGVVVLYYQIARNPNHMSEEELLAECLVRIEVVEPGFTAQDFERAMQSGVIPWDSTDPRVTECYKNPLDLF